MQNQYLQDIPSVSIAIPVFNEADGILTLSERLGFVLTYFRSAQVPVEVIFANDGSTDGTPERIAECFRDYPEARVINSDRNHGFGHALHAALRDARHEVVVTIDADTNYNHLEIPLILSRLKADVDIVTGSPFHPDGYSSNFPWYRFVLSTTATNLYKWVLGPECTVHTMTCGFRAYRRSILPLIYSDAPDFLATAELLVNAFRYRLRVIEYPVEVSDRRHGASKLRLVKTTFRHIGLMRRIHSDFQAGAFFRDARDRASRDRAS